MPEWILVVWYSKWTSSQINLSFLAELPEGSGGWTPPFSLYHLTCFPNCGTYGPPSLLPQKTYFAFSLMGGHEGRYEERLRLHMYTSLVLPSHNGWLAISFPKPEWQYDLFLQKSVPSLKTLICKTKFSCLSCLKVELYQGIWNIRSFRVRKSLKLHARFYVYEEKYILFRDKSLSGKKQQQQNKINKQT